MIFLWIQLHVILHYKQASRFLCGYIWFKWTDEPQHKLPTDNNIITLQSRNHKLHDSDGGTSHQCHCKSQEGSWVTLKQKKAHYIIFDDKRRCHHPCRIHLDTLVLKACPHHQTMSGKHCLMSIYIPSLFKLPDTCTAVYRYDPFKLCPSATPWWCG